MLPLIGLWFTLLVGRVVTVSHSGAAAIRLVVGIRRTDSRFHSTRRRKPAARPVESAGLRSIGYVMGGWRR
jgi:hypothetical protein